VSASVPPRRLWLLLIGFCLWALALVVLDATHAVGCAFGWSTHALRLGLALIFVVHLAAVGWLVYSQMRSREASTDGGTAAFLQTAVTWVSIAAFAAVILTLGPALLLETCL
jgi:Na+-transporting NADH:ubiquinone oxidoreductase subunit NqrE